MDWQSWVDEGLIVRDEQQKREAPDTVSQAWDVALHARQSYLAGDLDTADKLLREVFLTMKNWMKFPVPDVTKKLQKSIMAASMPGH